MVAQIFPKNGPIKRINSRHGKVDRFPWLSYNICRLKALRSVVVLVTIKDVAKKAGVSIAAVSYALNDKEGVNEATKTRIREIADEMGYIPNSLARGLLLKKTNVIGLVVPDISNPYISSFIKHLDRYARNEGFFILLASMSNPAEHEDDIIHKLAARHVDGFIITPASDDQDQYRRIAAKLNKQNIPFLFANMSFSGIKSNYVIPDLEEGEYQLTTYLLQRGFRDFVFAGGDQNEYYTRVRYQGFLRALSDQGLTFNEERYLVCGPAYSFDDGYTAARHFLEHASALPEVFVALNDFIACGMIKAFRQRGIRVPQDVCMVGFDDLDMPTTDTVPLTTVRIPVEEMAGLCLDILKSGRGNKVLRQMILPTEVVIRESSLRV
jgi:LacI family transcriptional regulator